MIDPRKVYDILVEECGASERQYKDFGFAQHWPDCNEWRFVGNQGFGGKIWSYSKYAPPFVSCYGEQDTPERKAARERANDRLTLLWQEWLDSLDNS